MNWRQNWVIRLLWKGMVSQIMSTVTRLVLYWWILSILNTSAAPRGVSRNYLSCSLTQTVSQFKDSINCLPCHLSSLCSFTQTRFNTETLYFFFFFWLKFSVVYNHSLPLSTWPIVTLSQLRDRKWDKLASSVCFCL